MQRGVSLLITLIALSIILSLVLGLVGILVGQYKTIREIGNSVNAFYMADMGTERVLKDAMDQVRLPDPSSPGPLVGSYSENLNANSSYTVTVVCCSRASVATCYFDSNCPNGIATKTNCQADFFCIRAEGSYKNTKRTIETKVYPLQ